MKKNPRPMLAVFFCAAFVAAFNENLVNVGLVDIMAEFSIDSATAQWLVTGYMIVTAIVVTVVAFLLKRLHLRTLFFLASGVLVAGSLAAIAAPNYPALLACRLLQAVGTGLFIPSMMNTVLTIAPRKKLGTYLSVGSCAITFGPAFAPVVSGLMVTAFGWRSMFVVPAVAMALLLVLGALLIYNITEPENIRLDIPSLLLSAAGLTAFVYGLSTLTGNIIIAAISLVVGIGAIMVFALRQNRLEHPLMNLRPLRNGHFAVACLLVVIAMMATFSMSVLLPLYFEGAAGTSALLAGALILVPILVNSATALFGGRTMDRRGEWPLLPIGFALIVAGFAFVFFTATRIDPLLTIVGAVLIYAGVGAVMSPSQTSGLKHLPHELNTYGVGLMSEFIQIAACIGPALFVGVLSTSTAAAEASGASSQMAQAVGFADAVLVACAIGAAGLALSLAYALRCRAHAVPTAPSKQAPTLSLEAVMEPVAWTVARDATVFDAMQLMIEHHTSGLPVTDKTQCVCGFISDGDIMKSLANQDPTLIDLQYGLSVYADSQTFDDRLTLLMQTPVIEVATENVIALKIDMPIEQVCRILGTRRIKKAPVVSEGKLVGTVSRNDVTRRLMGEFIAKQHSMTALSDTE